MYKIYEIRNKATHRVEFLNLFNATQEKPDDVFRADPESQKFANRHDLYLYVNFEDYLNLDHSMEELAILDHLSSINTPILQ